MTEEINSEGPRPRNLLLLEGVPFSAWDDGIECIVHRAHTQTDAALLMQHFQPDYIVIRGDVAWHRAFVSTLPPERRPAVLGVGRGSHASALIADEWMFLEGSTQEMNSRMRLARERARTRRQAARKVFVDGLTGLPNRRSVMRALMRESHRGRRMGAKVSLVLLDLDDFKRVNDTQGHPAGDRLLRRVGAALRRVTRANEACGRIGGDEFAIVIAGGLEQAVRAGRRAEAALRGVGVVASLAAREREPDEQLRAFYRRTDDALNHIKQERRRAATTESNAAPGELRASS